MIMKNSLHKRLFAYFACITVMIVFFSWLMNSLFLERFYMFSKKKELVQNYVTINQLYNMDSSSLPLELEKLQLNRGMQLVVFNDNLDAVFFCLAGYYSLGRPAGIGSRGAGAVGFHAEAKSGIGL